MLPHRKQEFCGEHCTFFTIRSSSKDHLLFMSFWRLFHSQQNQASSWQKKDRSSRAGINTAIQVTRQISSFTFCAELLTKLQRWHYLFSFSKPFNKVNTIKLHPEQGCRWVVQEIRNMKGHQGFGNGSFISLLLSPPLWISALRKACAA